MLGFFLTANEVGQALLAVLVAGIGYTLHRKEREIHFLVNSQMTEALSRIKALEEKLGLSPGEAIPTDQPEKR